MIFDQFESDPRVQKLKAELVSVYQSYQSKLSTSKKSDPALEGQFNTLLSDVTAARGGALWYPYLGTGMGNGALVELADGSVKYDFISGIGAHWGHGHPDIVKAVLNSAFHNTVMEGNLQQNVHTKTLLSLFCELSDMDHCFLTTSGAMAAENALKLAFHKHQPAKRLLAFEGCFMGRTLGLSQITDKAAYRNGLPLTLSVDYLPFFDETHPEESIKNTIKKLNDYISRYPGDHAAICMELIQGEGGYYPGSKAFFDTIMEVCKTHNIAVIVDEIQTFGRTTHAFAYQYFNLKHRPDIITVGKLSQVCATLFSKEYKPGPGLISQTFTGSSAGIDASITILSSLKHGGYLGETGIIHQRATQFRDGLTALSKTYPDIIAGPFGVESMMACTVYDGSIEAAKDFMMRLFKEGVIGFIAGKNPVRCRFLMPIGSVTSDDISQVLHCIERTLKKS